MTGIEPWICGVRGNHSTNWATPLPSSKLAKRVFLPGLQTSGVGRQLKPVSSPDPVDPLWRSSS